MRKAIRNVLVGMGAVTVLAASSPAWAHGSGGGHHGKSCAAKFDEAQRTDMESFRDFDADAWRDGHDPNAVSIFPGGQRFVGIDAIMAAQVNHFKNREAVWSWTELNRRVDGCHTAFIEYTATYAIPRINFSQTALTVVTYEFEHGKWLGILDQGTLLPPPAGG